MTEINHDAAAHRFIADRRGTARGSRLHLVGRFDDDHPHGRRAEHRRPRNCGGIDARGARSRTRTGWKVIPACSYAASYMRKNSDWDKRHQDELLDEALEETFPASDPPSVGNSS
jgi:hypothetical protein